MNTITQSSSATKHTPGPWSVPHFADPTCACQCGFVLADDGRCGAIATIHYDNGKSIENGGNDAPRLEEARANARLVAAAPELLEACKLGYGHAVAMLEWAWSLDDTPENNERIKRFKREIATIEAAIAKAEGRTN